MRDRKNSTKSDYVVGYGRPPKATQFAVGNNANPAGRPRGIRTLRAMLEDIMRQKVAVTENGKTRRIAVLEVALRRLANDAMRGDPKAFKLFLMLIERYSDSPETAIRLGDLLAEDRAILAQYLQKPGELVPDSALQPDDEEGGNGV